VCGTGVAADPATGSFGTSALIRPILQDGWLPTAVYVAGPAEIAYFAQLPPLYDWFGTAMPTIAPRARIRVVDDPARRLLEQLRLTPDALGRPRDELAGALVGETTEGPDPGELERALAGPIGEALVAFAPRARALDPALAKAVDKTRATVSEAVRRLAERYRRTLVQRDEVVMDRLDRLLARLQPGGAPQERVLGWPGFGARFGVDRLVDAVLGAIAPFDGGLREIRP
jgi:uncharacterized protein YllA (UPF0747 family)